MLDNPRTIEIEMEDPNFDVAVERAITKVSDDLEELEDSPSELKFVGLSVTLRSHFGRANHYVYKFEVK